MRVLTNKKQTWLCEDVHAELQEHRAWPAQCNGRRRACERRRARGTDLHGQPKKGREQGEEHARKKRRKSRTCAFFHITRIARGSTQCAPGGRLVWPRPTAHPYLHGLAHGGHGQHDGQPVAVDSEHPLNGVDLLCRRCLAWSRVRCAF